MVGGDACGQVAEAAQRGLSVFGEVPAVLKQLSLKRDKPIIVLRTEESFASYLEGKVSDSAPVIGPVTEEILMSS